MTLLIVIAALIAAVTVWFVARPLRAEGAPSAEDREALVQLRDRLLGQLREIEVESGDRNIDENIAADERRRLEAELARVLRELDRAAASRANTPAASRSIWLNALFALAAILPIASAALYLGKNTSTLVKLAEARSPSGVATAQGNVPPMVLEMVGRLERRLAEQPKDPKGWAQLGRAYGVLGRQADARAAYGRAYEQAPDDADILHAYGEFLVSLNPSRPLPEAVTIYNKLLAMNPQDPGALWVLGIVAYNGQKFKAAADYWDRLLKILPPEQEGREQLRRAVDMARAQASGKKIN
jgi:cytochrome c-type biogenesis protein CcmH